MNPDEQNLPGVEFIDAAVAIANSLPTRERDEIMSAAAIRYSALGLLDDALKSADDISDSYTRDTALTQVGVNTVSAAPDSDPLTVIDSIDDPGNQNLALEEIAVKYAEQKLFDEAVEACGRLDDRDSALSRIAKIMGKEDSLEWSEELAREIDGGNTRTTCMVELARFAMKRNQVEPAENILRAAETEAGNESEYIEDRIYQLIAIADGYEELKQREKVKEILARALHLCNQIEGFAGDLPKTFTRDAAIADVASGFARSRHYAECDSATEQIENPFKFAQVSIEQAIARHEDGQDEQSLQILAEARELITSEPCKNESALVVRDFSVSQLAVAYATLSDFKTAISLALLIARPETQLTTMLELAWSAAKAGFSDSLFEIQETIPGDYQRVTHLVSICHALLERENKELAVKLLLRAVADCEKIPRADQRSVMLIKIASALIGCDLESKANELLSEILNATIKLEDTHQQAQILVTLAEEYRKHARPLSANEKQLLEELPT